MLDVLVVGAGPTGLTLARQLQAFGCAFRIVDRHLDRAQESRAVAVQPRTLEVLAPLGATEQMLAHGNRAVAMSIHAGSGRVRSVPLFDLGLADTAYPFLLFLSQAETERIFDELLRAGGATVERGVELVSQEASDAGVRATLRHPDGRVEHVEVRYLAGCDGARSTVRQGAGIEFVGGTYPQTFVLADVEVDGIAPDCAHVFITRGGILFFFPLGVPATWRLLSMRRSGSSSSGPSGELTLAEVQSIVDSHAPGEGIRLRDPAWLTTFRLYHRRAARYRAGPVFLAGDAAHIHSPAGGQGMNIGIQDAVNLGWKLALGGPALLDSYQVEREPVGRDVLRFTDRAFTVATTTNALVRMARAALVPLVLPLALRARWARAAAFRTVAELGIGYRGSPLAVDGPAAPRHGPRAGDRLPDAPVHRDGVPTSLHAAVSGPSFHLLVCSSGRISVGSGSPAVLDDADVAMRRLGVPPGGAAVFLVRPDGHIAYRAGGTDPAGALALLARWVPGGDRPI